VWDEITAALDAHVGTNPEVRIGDVFTPDQLGDLAARHDLRWVRDGTTLVLLDDAADEPA
jgi:hypothetical protein